MVLSLPVSGFSCHFVFVITQQEVVSEPVPAVVVTQMMGNAGFVPSNVAWGPPAR
jgi:hypothetical protein